jgi:hypothetical protein
MKLNVDIQWCTLYVHIRQDQVRIVDLETSYAEYVSTQFSSVPSGTCRYLVTSAFSTDPLRIFTYHPVIRNCAF